VVIVTSVRLEQAERERLRSIAAGIVSKDSLTRDVVNDAVRGAISGSRATADG
jgi:DNA-binding NarL/FixJ family response regulator